MSELNHYLGSMEHDLDHALFNRFKGAMWSEYIRHFEDKGGRSWVDCDPMRLLLLLNHSIEKHSFEELKENPSHFIDIANFAFFCYQIFNHNKIKIDPPNSTTSNKAEADEK